jgi:hypothetical protein
MLLDTDNDSVFMNETVRDYCQQVGIEFTRCRPYRKNGPASLGGHLAVPPLPHHGGAHFGEQSCAQSVPLLRRNTSGDADDRVRAGTPLIRAGSVRGCWCLGRLGFRRGNGGDVGGFELLSGRFERCLRWTACSLASLIPTAGQVETGLSILGSVVIAASMITSLTPTPAPGTRLARVYRCLELAALLFGRAKDTGALPATPQVDKALAEAIAFAKPKGT